MNGNISTAKANIEAKRFEHCFLISLEQKTEMVVPLCNIIAKANGDERGPLLYVLSHPELLNLEVANWAMNMAQATFDAIPYLEAKSREWNQYNNSAYNLACVAFLVARELKYFSVAILSMELQIKLAEIGGANKSTITGMKDDLKKLRKLATQK
jgi:hypothetical protein